MFNIIFANCVSTTRSNRFVIWFYSMKVVKRKRKEKDVLGYTPIYAHWNMADSLSSNVFVAWWQNVTNPSYLWSKSSFSSVDHIVLEIWNVNSIWMGRVISTDKVWDYYIHFPFMEMDHYPGSDISATKIATNWASNHLFTAWHHFVIFWP